MAANAFAQRGTKGGLFEKEWFRHIEQRQDVRRRTESLWSDRSRPPRKPKALPPAKAWAPGDERTPVIIVTGPIGGGKSSVVGHLAARDALVVTHRYWQDWGTTPLSLLGCYVPAFPVLLLSCVAMASSSLFVGLGNRRVVVRRGAA